MCIKYLRNQNNYLYIYTYYSIRRILSVPSALLSLHYPCNRVTRSSHASTSLNCREMYSLISLFSRCCLAATLRLYTLHVVFISKRKLSYKAMYVRIAVYRGKKSKKKKKWERYTYARGDSAANFNYDNRYTFTAAHSFLENSSSNLSKKYRVCLLNNSYTYVIAELTARSFYEETAGHFATKLSGCIISRVRLLVLRLLESSSEINPPWTTALVVLRASICFTSKQKYRACCLNGANSGTSLHC